MKIDPRVSTQPISSQDQLDAALNSMMRDDPTFAEMYVRKKELERVSQLQREHMLQQQMQTLREQFRHMGIVKDSTNWGGIQSNQIPGIAGDQTDNYSRFRDWVAARKIETPQSPPLDENSPRADEAQEQGLKAMNPIARHRFEPIIKLMGIKVRFTNASYTQVKQWILAKPAKDGQMVRQEWTAPSQDPGCSLRTWEAMMAEFLDEVARRDGIQIPTDADKHHSTESAGDQAQSGAGDPRPHPVDCETDERRVPLDAPA